MKGRPQYVVASALGVLALAGAAFLLFAPSSSSRDKPMAGAATTDRPTTAPTTTQSEPAPPPTTTEPAALTTPARPRLRVLLREDFSEPKKNLWFHETSDSFGETEFQNGSYRVLVKENQLLTVDQPLDAETAVLRVDVDLLEVARGTGRQSYGVVCTSGTDALTFGIDSSSGRYEIYGFRDDTGFPLAEGRARSAIGRPGRNTHIRAECGPGGRATLRVNGKKVGEGTDAEIGGFDRVGLFVESRGGTAVVFDNLVVRGG